MLRYGLGILTPSRAAERLDRGSPAWRLERATRGSRGSGSGIVAGGIVSKRKRHNLRPGTAKTARASVGGRPEYPEDGRVI